MTTEQRIKHTDTNGTFVAGLGEDGVLRIRTYNDDTLGPIVALDPVTLAGLVGIATAAWANATLPTPPRFADEVTA
jgi:hypothetical protein